MQGYGRIVLETRQDYESKGGQTYLRSRQVRGRLSKLVYCLWGHECEPLARFQTQQPTKD